MIVGIDFDNTIVSYDTLFKKIATERGLISSDFPASKEQIRDHLRKQGQEDAWTHMQGEVYGNRMSEAEPFSGFIDFAKKARKRGLDLFIISHKTKTPFAGPPYDLHLSASNWLRSMAIIGPDRVAEQNVFFELTKEAKLARIKSVGCKVFIDDLPEILNAEEFPADVEKLLFSNQSSSIAGVVKFNSWQSISEYLLKGER